MAEDLLQRAKRLARRITKEERMESNMGMFRQLGLDEQDVDRMAREVGLERDDLLLLPAPFALRQPPPAAPGRPGRRADTKDIADFANARRPHMTWDEIYREWKRLYPDDHRVTSKETIRGAHRRFYGDKAKKP